MMQDYAGQEEQENYMGKGERVPIISRQLILKFRKLHFILFNSNDKITRAMFTCAVG